MSDLRARGTAREHAIMGPAVPSVGGSQVSAHACVHTHSPAGGALPSASMLPPGRTYDYPGPLGGRTYDYSPQHTDTSMHIAHMRHHEYPAFMSFHMQQGMSHEEAHARWAAYESMRVSEIVGGGAACGVHM